MKSQKLMMPMHVSFFLFFFIAVNLNLSKINIYLVYEKQKKEGISEEVKADTVEEYEDGEGNVYNKKTYEDLKRQGIL